MKKIILILCGISLVLSTTIYIIYQRNKETNEVVEDILEEEETNINDKEEIEENKQKVVVDIKGMVTKPGVYEVEEDSRVNDVITLAGGLLEGADTSNINLAKIVEDEMTIIVYSTEEVMEKYKNEVCICDCPYIENNACIEETEEDNLVNINTAGVEELTTLTGIGDVKAEAIIKYRNDYGKFNSIEDILNVDGIGESLFEKIKDNIKV